MKNLRFFRILIFAVIILLLLTACSKPSVPPTARGYHQMSYDSESGRIVVYGGQTGDFSDETHNSYETWLFDPKSNGWTQKSPPATPGGFTGGDMTYDSKADRSILSVFAWDFTTLQTWAYDDKSDTWTRLADGPVLMVGQRLAYDSESDRIIMFGGFTLNDSKYVDETWVYDYNTDTWTNLQPSVHPNGRNYHGMVYDSKADRIVMWGGDIEGGYKPPVWTYDYNTNTWQELGNTNAPAVRDYINLAYDSQADKIIMYGGYSHGNDETWIYDLSTNTWQQMQPSKNPGTISRYTMIYVGDINKTILYGGQDGPAEFKYLGNTWSYNLKANRWTDITPGQ